MSALRLPADSGVAFDEFNGVKAGPAVGILDAIASEVDRD
jgi:hypothetical protein